MMDKIKLSLKDERLLELLDINSKSTLGFLADRLNLSKQAIRIKLKNITQKEIIINYISIVDFFKLGYNNMHLYLTLQGIDKKIYNKKLEDLKKIREVIWIAELFGESNLGGSILYKNILELSKTLNRINKIFGQFIIHRELHLISKHLIFGINFVSKNSKSFEINQKEDILEIEKLDGAILSEIKNNSRFSYVDLSDKLQRKPETIKKHILLLEKRGIIRGYKVLFNYNKLGYLWNLCMLKITAGRDITNLLTHLKKEKRVPFISITVENHIIIDFLSRDYQELKEFLNFLKEKNEEIESYKILNVEKIIRLKSI